MQYDSTRAHQSYHNIPWIFQHKWNKKDLNSVYINRNQKSLVIDISQYQHSQFTIKKKHINRIKVKTQSVFFMHPRNTLYQGQASSQGYRLEREIFQINVPKKQVFVVITNWKKIHSKQNLIRRDSKRFSTLISGKKIHQEDILFFHICFPNTSTTNL